MKGFKKCSNGHFYKEDLQVCPHCPGGGGVDLGKTKVNSSQEGSNFDKTQIFGQGGTSDNNDIDSGNGATQVFGAGNQGNAPGRDLDKTYIGGITVGVEGEEGSLINIPRAARMITGWLVSFTLDPMGVDYRIYEGNNTIGRDPGNSISITSDHTISGKHANILHKKGKFWIKDEMAANGTFVNGNELEIEKAFPISDGDEVKLGDTIFTFKTWH